MRADDGGNTGCGRGGKPKGRFSTAPTALGNRKRRDSHIPPAATKQWKSGKPKSRLSTFPLLCFPLYISNQKGGLAADRFAPASRLILG